MYRERELGFIRSSILAGALALGGSGVSAANPDYQDYQKEPTPATDPVYEESKRQREEWEAKELELVLDLLPEILNTDYPSVSEFIDDVTSNSVSHVTVLDPLGSLKYGYPEGSYIYTIYKQEFSDVEDPNDWSVEMIINDNKLNEFPVTVGVRLAKNGGDYEIYNSDSPINGDPTIDLINLGHESHELFDIPDSMRFLDWSERITGPSVAFEKLYTPPINERTSENQRYYQGFLFPDNKLYYAAWFSLPGRSDSIDFNPLASTQQEEARY